RDGRDQRLCHHASLPYRSGARPRRLRCPQIERHCATLARIEDKELSNSAAITQRDLARPAAIRKLTPHRIDPTGRISLVFQGLEGAKNWSKTHVPWFANRGEAPE